MKKVFVFILNLTWGIVATLIGLVLFLLSPTAKRRWYNGAIIVQWKWLGYSAFSLGLFIFTFDKFDDELNFHEYGHTVQNAALGPFYLFIMLLSVISFNINPYKHPKRWFERWADRWGG